MLEYHLEFSCTMQQKVDWAKRRALFVWGEEHAYDVRQGLMKIFLYRGQVLAHKRIVKYLEHTTIADGLRVNYYYDVLCVSPSDYLIKCGFS